MTVRRIAWKPIILAAAVIALAGCGGATTETGYQPKRLGMSGSEVRSLYAPAFSPDSHPAQDNAPSGLTRKPG
jgi:hypothetical protein